LTAVNLRPVPAGGNHAEAAPDPARALDAELGDLPPGNADLPGRPGTPGGRRCGWQDVRMSESDPKADLRQYLQEERDALLWKLEGLSEYDIRRPLVPTGTNLLGLVKHTAGTEAGYFGFVFERPFPEELPWTEEDAETNSDFWATTDESRADIVDLYKRVWAHSDATIEALPLDAPGRVPWWGSQRSDVTLQLILVHMIAETNRHCGHADIVRELVDGAVGINANNSNLPDADAAWWAAYRDRLESVAKEASR